ncbi:Hypothetical protein FKW44_006308 [Caligus rogercresseyi]|uniref:Uncharacterized protein n=1 Tax=Caligus rogercresseyi TaxID=217165 RepID=A0A7T8KD62_CALRO|nr:Hypothetical protein FKW44_006308 [Caligus rogercresseyi]
MSKIKYNCTSQMASTFKKRKWNETYQQYGFKSSRRTDWTRLNASTAPLCWPTAP